MAAHSVRRRRSGKAAWLLALGAVVGVLTLFAGAAGAYWSSTGNGSGSATTGTLAAPTNLQVPATSAGSVQVTWTASTGTPVPTGYYVTRTAGTTTTAACGTSATSTTTATSCTDTGVPGGTYTYTVTAVYKSWTAASSASSSVQVASKLAFTGQPAGAQAGVAFSASVTLQDPSGNTVAYAGQSVTVALGANPGSGTLSGTLTASTNASGVATFSNLSINKVGTGYTLTATSTGLTGATSNPFNITPGAATKLSFTTSPSNSTGGVAFATQPVVTVQDANGNTVTGDSSQVTLAITTPNGATLSCTSNPQGASSGVATFSGCAINKAGTYTLTATDGTLTSAVSNSFTITVGPATQLAFTTQPSGASAGSAFTSQPQVTVQDAGGNKVAAGSYSVTLAITSGTGTAGAAFTCSANPVGTVSGVSSFAGCMIDKSGPGYTITASATGLTAAISASFNVNPTITSVSPTTLAHNNTVTTVTVKGTGFENGATVSLSDSHFVVQSVTFISATQITVTIKNTYTNNGAHTSDLTVTNPDGTGVTKSAAISN